MTHDRAANPLGTILGVWGHPDDESWLSAGLMARAARAGDRVVCVTATRGELGSPDEALWPPGPPLAAVRTKELEACFVLLGVKEHHWLDYPDGGCRDVDQDEAVRRVSEIMAEVQPDTVLTFGPDGMTGHDDHKAVCAWATAAFRDVGKPGAVLGYATNTPEWLAEPPCTPRDDLLFFVDLAGDELATKLAAMRVMTSQVTGLIDGLGEDFFRSGLAEESFRRP
jgi:LmbE family N-acetylglucosaminyl deacetylase